MKKPKRKFIFIYNANSGLVNGLMDSAHKLLSPETYACSLCALTYGSFGMKKEWKSFIAKQELEIDFFHKDDLPSSFNQPVLPVILNQNHSVFISSEDLQGLDSLEKLIELFKSRMS